MNHQGWSQFVELLRRKALPSVINPDSPFGTAERL